MRHTEVTRVIWRDKVTGKEARGSGAMAGWFASHPERYEQVTVPRHYCSECPREVDPPFDLCDSCARKLQRAQEDRDARDAPYREPDGSEYV